MAEPLDPNMRLQRALVVGAGIAGLVAARDLARVGVEVTVINAGDRPGGQVRREIIAGLPVEVGAESFALRGGAVEELIRELGLTDELRSPNPRGAWLRLPEGSEPGAVPIPAGGILGIPSNPFAPEVRAVIGWSGVWRAYVDRIRPVLSRGQERNLGEFVRRRLGARVRDRLVAPVTRGVYSMAPEQIDLEVAAPGFNGALVRAGSLTGAVAMLRADAVPGAPVRSVVGGMSVLVSALIADIEAHGGRILNGHEAVGLRASADVVADLADRDDEEQDPAVRESQRALLAEIDALPAPGWVLDVVVLDDESPTPFVADVVLLAAAEDSARLLLNTAGVDLPRVGPTPESEPRIDVVTLVVDQPDLDAAPRGSGLLVVEGAPVLAKALTHATAKWSWLGEHAGRSNPHRHVLRLSYGGHGIPSVAAELAEDDLIRIALRDAADLLGVPLNAAHLRGAHRTVWQPTRPVTALGQAEHAAGLRALAAALPGLDVAGAWVAGTGLAAVVPDALASAQRLRREIVERYVTGGATPEG